MTPVTCCNLDKARPKSPLTLRTIRLLFRVPASAHSGPVSVTLLLEAFPVWAVTLQSYLPILRQEEFLKSESSLGYTVSSILSNSSRLHIEIFWIYWELNFSFYLCSLGHFKVQRRAGEMAQRLRALTVLLEVLSSKPHGGSRPFVMRFDALFWCV